MVTASNEPPIDPAGIVAAAAICNDVAVDVLRPVPTQALMQTNGALLCLDLIVSKAVPDFSRILLVVHDEGHSADGAPTAHSRSVAIQDMLRGPVGTAADVDGGPQRLLLVLADPIFNQDSQWRSTVDRIDFLDGWLPGRGAETIPGDVVQRLDNLRYPPFPVRPVNAPFRRVEGGELLPFEVTGVHEWGRDHSMFARVEAWAVVDGVDGPVVGTSEMVASLETPEIGTPSGLLAPVYRLLVSAAGLGEGTGELRYRVLPHIGPPWSSVDGGEDFPTINAPRGVPFCHDLSGSWAPLFGIVSLNGIGLAGNDPSGLGLTIETAIASGLSYKDCAAVAAAVRLVNASAVSLMTASGPVQRLVQHNDIAGGVAVLRAVAGSVAGQNYGAYVIRTGFASQASYPPGATCFEIRSESGIAAESVRLRGIDSNGVVMSSASKAVASRLLLRGVWLDGTNTASSQNVTIDGTAAAGEATRAPSALACAYLITVDCVVTENPGAGSAAPSRFRPGLVWDIRLRAEGNSGAQSTGTVSAFAGFVSSIGCSYAATNTGRRFPLTAMLGCRLTNLGVEDRSTTGYPVPKSRVMLNVRIDFNKAFTSPAIRLGNAHPSLGGLGIGNVFCRATVNSSGPLIRIAGDGSMYPIDNLIIRHLGSDLFGATKVNNGRANLLYQDFGYVRVDKIGSVGFSAFRSYNCKGDSYPDTETASTSSKTWVAGQSYKGGALVHDSIGAATPASCFYQAIADSPRVAGEYPAALDDSRVWLRLGYIFGKPIGEQPLRQGNLRFRYHVGCHGNVACVTYNSAAFPGTSSGFGIRWGRDELAPADFSRFYSNPAGNDYRPNTQGADARATPLLNRVPAGNACLPFDLAGTPRLNDGSGAAGAYERI